MSVKAKFNHRIIVCVVGLMALCFPRLGLSAEADAKQLTQMTVSGGSIGGTSNLAANAFAAVEFRFCKIPATVTANSTFTQVEVIQKKEADVATVVGYQAYEAYKGIWKDKPVPELRTLFQATPQAFHIFVPKSSSIYSLMDLKGKRVVVGKRGFFAEDIMKKICAALELKYGEYFKPLNIGHDEAASGLVSGSIDAYAVMSNAPQVEAIQLTESHPMRVIGLSKDELDKVLNKYNYLQQTTITTDAYKGMDKDIQTVVGWMYFGATNEFPEDTAYCITKNFWENLDYAALNYSALKGYKLQDVQGFLTAPYHKGALRYYKERGLKVRDDMIPPEAK
jgi:uncharacterized protein